MRKYILGEHDFAKLLQMYGLNAKDTVRTVHEITIKEIPMDKFQASNWGHEKSNLENEKEIVIRVTGNGFLYNMVRIIAGTLIRVGRGFYEPEKDQRYSGGEGTYFRGNNSTAEWTGACINRLSTVNAFNRRI